MITKYKLYKNLNRVPEIGDYVVCIDNNEKLFSFLSNNIGKYVFDSDSDEFPYYIQYENIPEEIESEFGDDIPDDKIDSEFDGTSGGRQFSLKEIEYSSKNREDCVKYLKFKKFNLK